MHRVLDFPDSRQSTAYLPDVSWVGKRPLGAPSYAYKDMDLAFGWTTSMSSVFYTFDANGNVSELLTTNATVAAHYEYDPYGNVVASYGLMANDNPFPFSTKYWDSQTKLLYYGLRYDKTVDGRWLSRDPIGETGGENLYEYVGNNALYYLDYNGSIPIPTPPGIAKPIPFGKKMPVPPAGGKPVLPTGLDPYGCKTLAPWNKKGTMLGYQNPCWFGWCDSATLTAAGKALPIDAQECVQVHEDQHWFDCMKASFCTRCAPTSKNGCWKTHTEVNAYTEGISCAKKKLKKTSLSSLEERHLHCLLEDSKKQLKVYTDIYSKMSCKKYDGTY